MSAPPFPLAALQPVVFAAQLLSTLALFGLIWFVQIVHYPLFLRIAPEGFAAHEAEHATRTGYVAAPLMIAELLSAFLLLSSRLRPPPIPLGEARVGAVLAALTWAFTFGLQVPLHNRLHRGFNRTAIRQLVATNWLRTLAWTLRAALITHWVLKLVRLAA